MTTKTSNQEWVNITQLPYHTKREVITGKILDLIFKRSNGFSINRNLLSPQYGYMVGTQWNVRNWTSKTTRAEIESYVNDFLNLHENAAIYIGGWKSDDGTVFVEYSQMFLSKENAIDVAKEYGEIAIWDVCAKSEILINK